MRPEIQEILQRLPSVDEALRSLADSFSSTPRWALVQAVRENIAQLRKGLVEGTSISTTIDPVKIGDRVCELLVPELQGVINATGVVLHTNLGRAPLSTKALQRISEIAGGYCNLEYQIAKRQRGNRHTHVREILCHLTGAEDSLVVNNNAAALLLCLSALANGKEVVVSRGELIEIGGSFRLPDIMAVSGAHLREVGTTNRTHLRDYEKAIELNTGLLLKAHRSNFAIKGFIAEVEPEALVQVGKDNKILTYFDLGSGMLLDSQKINLPKEPTVAEAIKWGFDLVSFSGDKVLGGPQAGIILGKAEPINLLRTHPLMRALRPDKMTLAGLEATLEDYRDGLALTHIPVLSMLSAPEESIRRRADKIQQALCQQHPAEWMFSLVPLSSQVGGGAFPEAVLPSWGVALSHPRLSADTIEKQLRQSRPPIIARIENDQLLLDIRTVFEEQQLAFLASISSAIQSLGKSSSIALIF